MDVPELRFAVGRRGRLAWQRWGEGVDVVGVPPLAQDIERAWGWPDIVRMFERFGRIGRYLHYDKRGTGASDRLNGVPGIDERVEDMRVVMDDAGIERAWLFGNSDGGATALLFAATHPDRVHGLVLFGSGASIFPPSPSRAETAAFGVASRAFAASWGTRASPFVDRFAPSLARQPGFRRWHHSYERSCCDSATMRDLLTMAWETDVSDVCADVPHPTLLLHRVGDKVVDVERARETAALLPDATLVEVPGDDHLGYAGDQDAWLDEMERFVTGTVTAAPSPASAGPPSVRVATLGRFAVEVDGVEVPVGEWGSARARLLVKRLAVARGWPVRREELFALLWPDEARRSKLGARLSVQLSIARRVLHGGILADRETVRLDLDAVDLDLADLDRAVTDAEVVAVYAGTLLPGDEDLAFTVAPRAALHARFAGAAAALAKVQLATGMPVLAAETAQRMVELDAHDLRGHELLVGALLELEQPEQAAAAHGAWTAAADDLGLTVPPLDP